MEFLFELLPGRLLIFLIVLGFIAAGIYMWIGGGEARTEYDLAVGSESKTYQAEIRFKIVRAESSSGANDYDSGTVHVNYLVLHYDDENGEYQTIDAQVERDEYDSVKEGEKIKISFHTDNPAYVVTPLKERPGVIFSRIIGSIFIILGLIFILMILANWAD